MSRTTDGAAREPRRRGSRAADRPPRPDDRRDPAPRLPGRATAATDERKRVTVDAAGYRDRRAEAAAAGRRRGGRGSAARPASPVALDAMNAVERRVVHEYLRDRDGGRDVQRGRGARPPPRRRAACVAGGTVSRETRSALRRETRATASLAERLRRCDRRSRRSARGPARRARGRPARPHDGTRARRGGRRAPGRLARRAGAGGRRAPRDDRRPRRRRRASRARPRRRASGGAGRPRGELARKCAFIERPPTPAGLANAEVVPERAEDVGRRPRRRCDLVTARALAPLAVLAEYAAPLLRDGGVAGRLEGAPRRAGGARRRPPRPSSSAWSRPRSAAVAPYPGRRAPPSARLLRKVAPTPVAFPRRPGMAAQTAARRRERPTL